MSLTELSICVKLSPFSATPELSVNRIDLQAPNLVGPSRANSGA